MSYGLLCGYLFVVALHFAVPFCGAVAALASEAILSVAVSVDTISGTVDYRTFNNVEVRLSTCFLTCVFAQLYTCTTAVTSNANVSI